MIVNPITLAPSNRIYEALALMKKSRISGVPITEDGSKEGRLVGILTNRDLRFEVNVDRPISDIMTHENLITVPVGTTLDQARRILHRHKIEKLLVVDQQFRLKGLITVKDIQKVIKYPAACKDTLGRLRVGAAVGVGKDACSGPRRWWPRTWTCSSSTRRMATRKRSSTRSRRCASASPRWISSRATWRRPRRPRTSSSGAWTR